MPTNHHTTSRGTALLYDDGGDFLWVPLGQSVEAAEPAWRRMNDLRRLAIGAIRHQARRKNIHHQIRPDGMLLCETGCSTFTLSLARDLTLALEQHEPAEALVKVTTHCWSIAIKSPKIARGLLARAEADPDPAPVPKPASNNDLGDAISLFASASPIDWLSTADCDVEAGLQQAIERLQTPNTALLAELRRRLPPETITIEVTKPAHTCLDYPDGGDSLLLVPHSRRMTRQIATHGIPALADRIVARYEHLGSLRTQAFATLDHLIACAGLSHSMLNGTREYGRVHREAVLRSGRAFTLALGRHGIETTLRRWWQSQPALPVLDEAIWQQALTQPEKKPATRSLLSSPLSPSSSPASFAPPELAQIDARAAEILAEYRRRVENGQLPLHAWSQPWLYHPGRDTWVDEAWWLKTAQAAYGRNRDQHAAAILLANGDDTPREAVLASWRELDGYLDECCAAALVWQLWDHLPWSLADDSQPHFCFTRGSPPPVIAWRMAQRTRIDLAAPPDEGFQHPAATLERFPAADAREWLTPEEIEKVRQHALERAGASHPMVMLNAELLLTAQNMGWSEIATLISENPFTQASLDELKGRSSLIDAEWAVRLSAVHPTSFAARLAANVLSRSDDDIEREIDEESRQMETMLAQNFPDIPKQTPEQISEQKNIARHQHFDDLHKAAIAWHRWRGLLTRTDA